MTDHSPAEEAGGLGQILASGIEWMQTLKTALLEERDALERRDTKRLAAAAQSKEFLARKLLIVDRHRGEIETLSAQAASGATSSHLHGLARALKAVARECERLNLTNGTIIRSRQRQVTEGLAVLSGRERHEDTYTSAGAAPAAGTRRVLTEA